jgi:hypothetical protein
MSDFTAEDKLFSLVFSNTAFNGMFNRITFNMNNARSGLYFPITCNYPEALLYFDIVVKYSRFY